MEKGTMPPPCDFDLSSLLKPRQLAWVRVFFRFEPKLIHGFLAHYVFTRAAINDQLANLAQYATCGMEDIIPQPFIFFLPSLVSTKSSS
jgi:hypothetical protein